ncbi:MAG: hypothetical protein RL250_1291, partial [Verrucomicrobiota bacterium]
AAEASAKRAAGSAKIKAAIEAKDFDAVCKVVDEDFADATGSRKAIASINKAMLSARIDPANKERALKWADQAVAEAAGDEKLSASLKQYRDRLANGAAPATPKAGEAVPAKKVEVKKTDKGA